MDIELLFPNQFIDKLTQICQFKFVIYRLVWNLWTIMNDCLIEQKSQHMMTMLVIKKLLQLFASNQKITTTIGVVKLKIARTIPLLVSEPCCSFLKNKVLFLKN